MSIDWAVNAGVATITINRPERKNAINGSMRQDLERRFREAQDDPEIRAIILTGGGNDFSAGADIGEMGGPSIPDALLRMRRLHRMTQSVAGTNKPVIAAVRGVCIGMSWSLALACDIVVAADNARFQCPFRHLGLAPDGGIVHLLTRHLPLQRAKDIIYSARFVSGTEAHALGLALYAVPEAEVTGKANELAATFAKSPTLGLSMAKRQFDAAPAQSYAQALELEAVMQPLMTLTDDFQEGINSFREKRPAVFRGY